MGNWNITVRGVGCHHNKDIPTDADRMAAKFVKDLKDAGHLVSDASITHGAETSLNDPEQYLAEREANAKKP